MFSTEPATLNLNTHKVVKLLQERGYSEEQAEGFIDAVEEINLTGVATNQGLSNVRDELKDEILTFRNELKDEINNLRNEVKSDIHGLRTELKGDIHGLRNELKNEMLGLEAQINNQRHELTKLIYVNSFTTVGILTAVIALFKLFA